MKQVGTALALLLASAVGASADSYFCVTTATGGVSFDKAAKKWKGTAFKNDEKWIIRPATKKDCRVFCPKDTKIVVAKLGASRPTFTCPDFNKWGVLLCEIGVGNFRFSKETNRFIHVYEWGFIDGTDNNDNTPAIAVGTCSQIK